MGGDGGIQGSNASILERVEQAVGKLESFLRKHEGSGVKAVMRSSIYTSDTGLVACLVVESGSDTTKTAEIRQPMDDPVIAYLKGKGFSVSQSYK